MNEAIPGMPPCEACGHPILDGEDYAADYAARRATHYGRCPSDPPPAPRRATKRQLLDLMEK